MRKRSTTKAARLTQKTMTIESVGAKGASRRQRGVTPANGAVEIGSGTGAVEIGSGTGVLSSSGLSAVAIGKISP